MPLYEYDCRDCGHRFELLIRGPQPINCPECNSANVERAPSLFAVSSEAIKEANVVKARNRNLAMDRDKTRTEIDDPHRH